jgi:hypothetical protein
MDFVYFNQINATDFETAYSVHFNQIIFVY